MPYFHGDKEIRLYIHASITDCMGGKIKDFYIILLIMLHLTPSCFLKVLLEFCGIWKLKDVISLQKNLEITDFFFQKMYFP